MGRATEPWRILAATVLLVAPLCVAQADILEGRLVDEGGLPIAGAAVHLHRAKASAVTDEDGRFTLPRPEADDVLAIARKGHAQAFRYVRADDAAPLLVTLPRAAPPPPSNVTTASEVALNATLGVVGVTSPRAAQRVVFEVGQGARGAEVKLDWTPRNSTAGSITLLAEVKSLDGNATAGWMSGNAPLDFPLPAALVAAHPGAWEVLVQPADSLFPETVRVHVDATVAYGPLDVKRVDGAPPLVEDAPGSDGGAPPTMDVLSVDVTNETDAEMEVRIGLAQVGTMTPTRLAYAHWTAEWSYAGRPYFVMLTTSARGDDPPAFRVGDCRDVCSQFHAISGALEYGSPGAIRFTVPKAHVGSPEDGAALEGLRAVAYESLDDPRAFPRDAPRVVSDATPAAEPYAVGAHEYDAPPDVAALARDEVVAPASVAPAPRADFPWLLALLLSGSTLLAVAAVHARAAQSRYVFVRVLGKGANGRVVLARDRVLDHLVAIKETWRDAASPDVRERVLREARTLARLTHPNVVRVHDVLEEDGALRIVMEHVAGGSLDDRLARGTRLPHDEALRAWRDVLRGLSAAHALGIVHGDVKPANVLLTPEGDAKLGDFGLARSPADATLPGTDAALAGTPAYMAPEQMRGEAPTAASDVFAAAVLAYRALAGRLPADLDGCRTPWDVMAARAAAGPPPPIEDAAPEVNEMLAACLQDDPLLRPGADAALRRLEAITATGSTGPR